MTDAGPRPLIGLSAYRQRTRWWSWDRDAALVPGVYLHMVVAAGGWPVLLPPPGAADGRVTTADGDAHAATGALVGAGVGPVLDALDGLVVIGGGDLAARRYGQEPDSRNAGTNDQRDELELQLLAGALDRDLPVLAVCRGLQVLNVLCGGDLVQHLPDAVGSAAHQPAAGAFGPIAVTTEEGSTVWRLLGARTEVLCSHHQAIGRVGDGLVVTARGADGVIEAVEMPDRAFTVGVQWHPEESGDVRLFTGLVVAAGALRRNRTGCAHEGETVDQDG
jgi:putative glutamine amidotransferase